MGIEKGYRSTHINEVFYYADGGIKEIIADREGISQKVLTDSLRSMENDGLIIRTVYPEVPPRVEYSLSELGLTLKPILDSMVEWGNAYKKM